MLHGDSADQLVVIARTGGNGTDRDGLSAFIVDANADGVSRRGYETIDGLRAAEITFNKAAAELLGEEGMGFIYMMQDLPQERLNVSIIAIANAEAILEQTIAYVKERNAFGKPIATLQNTQFKLAELETQVSVARVFLDRCLELHIEHKFDSVMAAKAKLMTTDLQCKVIDECLQLHGGYGYMWEYPVARAFADSRVQRIYAGTNEVMKLIIGRDLLK